MKVVVGGVGGSFRYSVKIGESQKSHTDFQLYHHIILQLQLKTKISLLVTPLVVCSTRFCYLEIFRLPSQLALLLRLLLLQKYVVEEKGNFIGVITALGIFQGQYQNNNGKLSKLYREKSFYKYLRHFDSSPYLLHITLTVNSVDNKIRVKYTDSMYARINVLMYNVPIFLHNMMMYVCMLYIMHEINVRSATPLLPLCCCYTRKSYNGFVKFWSKCCPKKFKRLFITIK